MVMKDSGVEWIGEIPENWETNYLSQVFESRNIKVSDFDYEPLSVTKNGILLQLESAAKSSDHNNRKLVKKYDFVINSRSDRKMSSGVSEYTGSVSLINLVLKYSSEKIYPYFVNYLMKNYGFAEEFYRWGTGIVADLWSTNWERAKKIQIPIMRIEEQKKIADFLDDKTAKIDAIISDTKQSIEELKAYKQSLITETVTKGLNPNVEMKDSGVEWIGDIPKDWTYTKIKYLAKLDPQFNNLIEDDELATFLPMDMLKNGFLVTAKIDKIANLKKKYTYFKNGDIIFAKVRPSFENGNIAIAKNLKNGVGFGTTEIYVLRNLNKENYSTRFFFYFLQNINFIKNGSSEMTGVAGLKRISSKFVMNYLIPNIDFKLGEKIADFLDLKILKINNLISDKEQLVAEYESYKKSLIYEYVTGKKQVN